MSGLMPDMMGSAFDVQSLNQLKNKVGQQPQEGLRQVAQQLESVFVNMMLKSMRSALPQTDMLNSEQSKLYTSLYDQQVAQDLSHKGLGFADKIVEQLGRQIEPEAENSIQKPAENGLLQTKIMHQIEHWSDAMSHNALFAKAKQRLSQTSNEFIAKLLVPARIVDQSTGIPYMLILAQAALESGWGKKEILTENGKPSFNVFGIKAGKNWQGKSTTILTTEYIDGKEVKIKDSFRVYSSYMGAVSDYSRLLTRNKRYQSVLSAKTAEEAAIAIQKSGYATDPNYSKKLVQLIQQFKQSMQQTQQLYQYDLSELF